MRRHPYRAARPGPTRIRALIPLLLALSALSGSALAQTFTKNPPGVAPILADLSSGYSGAAWVDVNGDGSLDLFVANSFLYRGNGAGTFTKVATTIGAGIAPATGNGTTWADFDNDGDIDCYIASRGS